MRTILTTILAILLTTDVLGKPPRRRVPVVLVVHAVTPPPMANGDFNNDGQVNQADYDAFRNAFGRGPSPVFDFDNSGQVDQSDFNEFRDRFNLAATPLPPVGISFAAGVLTIRAKVYNSTTRVQPSFSDPNLIVAGISGVDESGALVLNQSMAIPISQLSFIYFYGQEGYGVSFINETAVSCVTFGGSGTSSIEGGSGDDSLFATGGNSTMRGMSGNDLLIGSAGNNYLYGGPGVDTLIPGPGPGVNILVQD